MKKIIREKYENGVLVSREIEATGTRWPKVAKIVIHLIVAISLATIAVVVLHDSLNAAAVLNQSGGDTSDIACPAQTFRS